MKDLTARRNKGRDRWRIRTNNQTCWSTGILEIETATLEDPGVDVFLLQETHLRHGVEIGAISSARSRAWEAGWHGLFGPARTTDAGRTSGGTAALCRRHYGIAKPEDAQAPPAPDRFTAAHFSGIVRGGITVASLYLYDSEPLNSASNDGLMRAVAEYLLAEGKPFVLAADWQVPPWTLRESAWPSQLKATVIAPRDDEVTCLGGYGGSLIDYFLVSDVLADDVMGFMVVEDAIT
jgi:hypothetical protein